MSVLFLKFNFHIFASQSTVGTVLKTSSVQQKEPLDASKHGTQQQDEWLLRLPQVVTRIAQRHAGITGPAVKVLYLDLMSGQMVNVLSTAGQSWFVGIGRCALADRSRIDLFVDCTGERVFHVHSSLSPPPAPPQTTNKSPFTVNTAYSAVPRADNDQFYHEMGHGATGGGSSRWVKDYSDEEDKSDE